MHGCWLCAAVVRPSADHWVPFNEAIFMYVNASLRRFFLGGEALALCKDTTSLLGTWTLGVDIVPVRMARHAVSRLPAPKPEISKYVLPWFGPSPDFSLFGWGLKYGPMALIFDVQNSYFGAYSTQIGPTLRCLERPAVVESCTQDTVVIGSPPASPKREDCPDSPGEKERKNVQLGRWIHTVDVYRGPKDRINIRILNLALSLKTRIPETMVCRILIGSYVSLGKGKGKLNQTDKDHWGPSGPNRPW